MKKRRESKESSCIEMFMCSYSFQAKVDIFENSCAETKDGIATLSQWSRGDVHMNEEPLKVYKGSLGQNRKGSNLG